MKAYRLLEGELAHKKEGCASRVYIEKGIDICYAEDIEAFKEKIKSNEFMNELVQQGNNAKTVINTINGIVVLLEKKK